MEERNIIVLDVETTGFISDYNKIIEIAAVVFTPEGKLINRFHEFVNPMKKIPKRIVELTGITDQKVRYCRPEKSVLLDFEEFMVDNGVKVVMAYNGKTFDLPFLKNRYKNNYMKWNETYAIYDPLMYVRRLRKKGVLDIPNARQPTVAKFFGIDYVAHTALEDTEALFKIYKKLEVMLDESERIPA